MNSDKYKKSNYEITKTISNEALISYKITVNQQYTLFPQSKMNLDKIIKEEIKKNAYDCDLNHIDVSKITDISYMFMKSEFNGDISNWDVANVKIMNSMFDMLPLHLRNNKPVWYTNFYNRKMIFAYLFITLLTMLCIVLSVVLYETSN